MHLRSASAALLVAAALAVAPVTAAVAAGPDTHPGAAKAAAAKARATARHLEHAANTHRSFVLGGTVTATTAAVAAVPSTDPALAVAAVPGTVTFVVHGTRFKALRGNPVTVTVPDTTKVTRDGAATLADVLVGDHVVVRAHQLDAVISKDPATGAWTLAGTAVALRLVASATADSVEPAPVVPVAPVVPAPTTAG